jgi:hypothetical protein
VAPSKVSRFFISSLEASPVLGNVKPRISIRRMNKEEKKIGRERGSDE